MMILNLSESLAKPIVMAKLNMAYFSSLKPEQNCCCPHCWCHHLGYSLLPAHHRTIWFYVCILYALQPHYNTMVYSTNLVITQLRLGSHNPFFNTIPMDSKISVKTRWQCTFICIKTNNFQDRRSLEEERCNH